MMTANFWEVLRIYAPWFNFPTSAEKTSLYLTFRLKNWTLLNQMVNVHCYFLADVTCLIS